MAIAALILGILSLVIGVVGFFAGPASIAGLVMGIVGIVLAAVAKKKGKKATGGLVCSIIGTVFCFIPAILWLLALVAAAAVAA